MIAYSSEAFWPFKFEWIWCFTPARLAAAVPPIAGNTPPTGDGGVPGEGLRAGGEEPVGGGAPAVARGRHHRQEPQAAVPERRRPRQARAGRVHPQDHPG